MRKKITIIVVDDHKLIRDMWGLLFRQSQEFELVGASGSMDEAIELVKKKQPDVIYMDINLGNESGVDLLPMLRECSARSKVVVISMHNQPAYVKKMFKLGASGYVTKNSPADEMTTAAQEVMKGNIYVCQELKSILTRTKILEPTENIPRIEDLTLREIEIIKLIKTGLSSREIGETLSLATRTVEVHRYNMFRKLKLKNAAALINFINNSDLNFT
ncbi:MAG: response regulator transcription factor [Chitinophagaceae bacterium]